MSTFARTEYQFKRGEIKLQSDLVILRSEVLMALKSHPNVDLTSSRALGGQAPRSHDSCQVAVAWILAVLVTRTGKSPKP